MPSSSLKLDTVVASNFHWIPVRSSPPLAIEEMEADSPVRSYENQDEEPRASGKKDYLDLNQAASKADDEDGADYQFPSAGEQWPQEGSLDADRAPEEPVSPPPREDFSRSPSPTLPSPAKRSQSPFSKVSASPEPREQLQHPGRTSPNRSVSPYGRTGSPLSPRRRSLSPREGESPRRSLSRSPDGRSGRADEGRKRSDRHVQSSRSPVGRSGRGVSPRGKERYGRSRSRSPPARDSYRRSRYSPRRRSSPPRFRSRRDRSPRRRPWSPPPNRSTGVGKPGNNLFVAGFSFVTTERDLEKKFSRFGRVTDCRIVRDRRSGDSRGFGFLSLERDEDADAAIRALDQTEWNGRIVLVEKAKTPTRY